MTPSQLFVQEYVGKRQKMVYSDDQHKLFYMS